MYAYIYIYIYMYCECYDRRGAWGSSRGRGGASYNIIECPASPPRASRLAPPAFRPTPRARLPEIAPRALRLRGERRPNQIQHPSSWVSAARRHTDPQTERTHAWHWVCVPACQACVRSVPFRSVCGSVCLAMCFCFACNYRGMTLYYLSGDNLVLKMDCRLMPITCRRGGASYNII